MQDFWKLGVWLVAARFFIFLTFSQRCSGHWLAAALLMLATSAYANDSYANDHFVANNGVTANDAMTSKAVTHAVSEVSDVLAAKVSLGREIFIARCALCHTIAGVAEHADDAPNLSNLASRRFIVRGQFALNEDNLRMWLRNPQGIAPGSYMPTLWQASDPERDAEIEALIAFLLQQ